jgi:hypothetical protein
MVLEIKKAERKKGAQSIERKRRCRVPCLAVEFSIFEFRLAKWRAGVFPRALSGSLKQVIIPGGATPGTANRNSKIENRKFQCVVLDNNGPGVLKCSQEEQAWATGERNRLRDGAEAEEIGTCSASAGRESPGLAGSRAAPWRTRPRPGSIIRLPL